ncbi:hypothetical protein FRC11_004986 [Ceratobasidium sp. 423]|nr:hypothetical protein FRC11_004986 [Ceratobasidium sp. 423]
MLLDLECPPFPRSTNLTNSQCPIPRNAPYAAYIQGMLQFVQSGLSKDGGGICVVQVMDWAEGQLDRYHEGQEFEKVNEFIAALPPLPTAMREDSRSPCRASTSSLSSEPPLDVTNMTGTKWTYYFRRG